VAKYGFLQYLLLLDHHPVLATVRTDRYYSLQILVAYTRRTVLIQVLVSLYLFNQRLRTLSQALREIRVAQTVEASVLLLKICTSTTLPRVEVDLE